MSFLKFTFFNCRKEGLLKKQIKSLSKIKNISLLMPMKNILIQDGEINFNNNNKQKDILIALLVAQK